MLSTKERLREIRDLKQSKYEVMCDLHYLRCKIAELDEEIKSLSNKIIHNQILIKDLRNFPNFKKRMRIIATIITIILFGCEMINLGNTFNIMQAIKYFLLYSSAGLSTYFLILTQEKKKFNGYTEQQLASIIQEQTDRLNTKEKDINFKKELQSILLGQKNSFSEQINNLQQYIPNFIVINKPSELSLTDDTIAKENNLDKMYCLKRPRYKNNIQK